MYIKSVGNGQDFQTELLLGIDKIEEQVSSEKSGKNDYKKVHRPEYLPFSKSVLLVKRNQERGHKSRCPRTPFLKAMYNCIAPMLRKGRSKLRVFVALGSSLDIFHGVDCFFDYEGKIVTVDVTISSWKERYKADVLITLEDIQRNEHYRKARFIAQLLQTR